jgi:hypothetical protein
MASARSMSTKAAITAGRFTFTAGGIRLQCLNLLPDAYL